jgi:hypothetical protein
VDFREALEDDFPRRISRHCVSPFTDWSPERKSLGLFRNL